MSNGDKWSRLNDECAGLSRPVEKVLLPVVEALPGIGNAIRRWFNRGGWSGPKQLVVSKMLYDTLRQMGLNTPAYQRRSDRGGHTQRTFFEMPKGAIVRFLKPDEAPDFGVQSSDEKPLADG